MKVYGPINIICHTYIFYENGKVLMNITEKNYTSEQIIKLTMSAVYTISTTHIRTSYMLAVYGLVMWIRLQKKVALIRYYRTS